MVSTNLNLLLKNIFKLYLPVYCLGKSRRVLCRVLCPNLLVILLVCDDVFSLEQWPKQLKCFNGF